MGERSNTESKDTMSPKVKEKACQMTSTHKLLFNQVETLNSKNSIVAATLGQNSWQELVVGAIKLRAGLPPLMSPLYHFSATTNRPRTRPRKHILARIVARMSNNLSLR